MRDTIKQKILSVKAHWNNKIWWKDVMIDHISKIVYPTNNGFYVLSEDWDYLIILDACRFDIFSTVIKQSKLYHLGKLEYRISRGSMTAEFLIENFSREKFEDIIYITANPFVDMLLKGRFYKIVSVWKDGWNEELKTVHPRDVYTYAIRTIEKYPTKRFIIHFMQPHFPYLTFRPQEDTGFSQHREAALNGKETWEDQTIWNLVQEGRVPLERVIKAYTENLRIALEYVEKLVTYLDGKIVITSDHGEAFGEPFHKLIPLKIYGHPRGTRIEPLVKVPWFIIEKPRQKKNPEALKVQKAIKNLKLKGKI
ncbi:LTA synthase family protein [Thermococcus sp. 21S7]|uniref:LTA synthase family protein n=1 Tax=Thermococcus sp. 21S7 TaxID=1638221 RepID=UPI00143A2FCD|nr:LTA synthase family protein [Thermococcus sp. 21S7]NJE62097.1 hypothetical protein [Thermococcus sp. 21S7]